MKFYIWSIEHNAWWKPNSKGYTRDVRKAGKYEPMPALEIVMGANHHKNFTETPNEALVPCEGMKHTLTSEGGAQ